ncbi:ribulose-phosphate 3-epimerase [Bacilli bacterium PM5-9]|nr:ribulose-phosphate 3-epimerase [Bacilli bacterium PM5-9]
MKIIAPSILACNFLDLQIEIKKLNNSKAKWIHFDVMDGHFVPNISFGPDIFKYFKNNSPLFTDVHIMVANPYFVAKLFVEAGANQIVFHYEACQNDEEIYQIIKYLKDNNVKVGISIKPNTEVAVLDKFLSDIDLVLIMSVEPGFGGQKFISSSLDKVKYLATKKNSHNFLIQIDGGIDNNNKDLCYEAGVDCLVAGSYLFKQDDFNKAVDSLL